MISTTPSHPTRRVALAAAALAAACSFGAPLALAQGKLVLAILDLLLQLRSHLLHLLILGSSLLDVLLPLLDLLLQRGNFW